MNKAFTKHVTIVLDEKWALTSDGDSGIVLTFSEMRKRVNKKTKLEEDYLFEDKWYTTRICQALRIYCEKVENKSGSLEELITNYENLHKTINKLDKEFRQF